jgi:hypothetical protein
MMQRAEGPLYTSLGHSPRLVMFSHKKGLKIRPIVSFKPTSQSDFDLEDRQNRPFFSGG